MPQGSKKKSYNNIVLDQNNLPIQGQVPFLQTRTETLKKESENPESSSAFVPMGYEGNSQYDIGVNPTNIQNIEEIRANRQSNLDAWGNGLGKLVGKTITDTGESLGYLGGGVAGLMTLDFDKVINNPMVNFFKERSDEIDKTLPIYETRAQKDAEWYDPKHLFSAKFLLGDMVGDGGSFLASAWLTGAGAGLALEKAGIKGIGNLLLKSATQGDIEAASTGTRILASQLNNLPKSAAAAVATYTEGAFESRQVYDDLIKSGKTQEEALDGAKKTLLLNMLTIPLSEFQFGSLFKSPDASKNAIKELFSMTEKSLLKDIAYNSIKAIKTGFGESIQEGLQQSIQDVSKANAGNDTSFLDQSKQVLGQFAEHFTDREYAESMLQGFILGAPFGAVESHKESKQDRNKLDFLREQYKNNVGNLFNEDIYDKESVGNIHPLTKSEYDLFVDHDIVAKDRLKDIASKVKNRETLSDLENAIFSSRTSDINDIIKSDTASSSEYKLNDKGEKLLKQATDFYHLEDLKNKALLDGDTQSYNILKERQFANVAYAKFEAGLGGRLQDELKLQGQKSPEEWQAQGMFEFERDETGRQLNPKEIADKWSRKASNFEDLYNTIQTKYNDTFISDEHRKAIWDEAVTQRLLKDFLNQVEVKKSQSTAFRFDILASDINSKVYEINSIDEKIAKLSKAIKSYPSTNFGAIQSKESLGSIRTNKAKEITGLKKQSKEALESLGYKVDEDPTSIIGVVDPVDDIEYSKIASEITDLQGALEDSRKRFDDLTNKKTLQKAYDEAKELAEKQRKEEERQANKAEEEAKVQHEEDIKEASSIEVEAIKAKPEEEKTPIEKKVQTFSEADPMSSDFEQPIAPDMSIESIINTLQEHEDKATESESRERYKTATVNIAYLSHEYEKTDSGRGRVLIKDRYNEAGIPIQSRSNIILSSPNFALRPDGSYEPLILFVDKDYKLTREDGTTDTYDSLSKIDGKTPIAIALKSNPTEIVGYVHDMDWVSKEAGNVAEQFQSKIEEETRKVRDLVTSQSVPVEAVITSKSIGQLNRVQNKKKENNYGFVNSLEESFGRQSETKANVFGESKIIVAKSLTTALDGNNSISKSNIVNTLIPGVVYMEISTAVKDKYIATPLNIQKLGSSNQIDVILKAIKIHLSKPESHILGGYDIATPTGLRNFINDITLTGLATKSKNKTAKADTFDVGLLEKTGDTKIEYGTSTFYSNKELSPEMEEGIKSVLAGKQYNVIASKLDSTNPYVSYKVEGDELVEDTAYPNYSAFLAKEVLKSYVHPEFTKDNERVFFAQPNISFEVKSKAQIEEKPKAVQKQPSVLDEFGGIGDMDSFLGRIGEIERLPSEPTPPSTPSEPKRKFKKRTEGEEGGLEDSIPGSETNLSPSFKDTNLRKYRLADLTLEQQSQITNTIVSNLLSIVENKGSVTKAFDIIYDKIIKEYESAPINSGKATILEIVLDNWDASDKFIGFIGLAELKLNDLSISIKEETIEEEESTLEKRNYSESATFRTNPKDTASARLKRALSFITVVDKNGEPVDSIIGTRTYYDFDVIYNQLMTYLADHQFEDMIPALEDLAKIQPQFREVLTKFVSGPKQELNEFMSNFKKRYSEFKTINFNINAKGVSLYTRSSNRIKASDLVATTWSEKFKNSKILSEVTEMDIASDPSLTGKLGALRIDIQKARKLSEVFDKIVATRSEQDIVLEAYRKLLEQIGIDINIRALQDLRATSQRNYSMPFHQLMADKVSFIFKRLSGSVKEDSSKDDEILFEDNNPFYGKERSIEILARAQAKYQEDLYSSSFRNAKGNSIFAYNNPTHLTDQFLKLTDEHREDYIKQLTSTAFASNSDYAKDLLDPSSKMSKVFQVSYLDAARKAKSREDALEYSEMSEKLRELVRLGALQNQGSDSIEVFGLTFSDKDLTAIITAPRIEVVNFDKDSSEAMAKLYNLAEAEYKRVQLTAQQIQSGNQSEFIKDYHDGFKAGTKFFLFPSLNDNPLIYDEKGNVRESIINGNMSTIVAEALHEGVREEINSMVEDKKNTWKELGIWKSYEDNLFDKTYKKKSRGKVASNEKLLDYAATDYVVNYAITSGNMIQLIHGDVALAGKKSLTETVINYYKRLAKDIAPGIEMNFKEKNFNSIFFNDVKTFSTSEYALKYYKAKNGKNPVEATDAQEVTTVQEHIDVMWSRGQILDSSYKSITDKIAKSIEDGTHQYELPKEEIDLLQPMKPVYVNMTTENGINKVTYIKTSSYPLLPQLTRGAAIDKLRIAMEKKGVQRAVFTSGVKLGIQKASDLYVDGKIREDLEDHLTSNRLSLPREGFKIQQDNPIKENKILQASQQRKNLFTNIPANTLLGVSKTSRIDLKKKYDELHSQLLDRRFNDLLKRFGVKKLDNGGYSIESLSEFYRMIKDEAISRDWSPNEIAAIELTEDGSKFKLPLMYSPYSDKIESLLTSIVTSNIVRSKLPGHSYIQGSSIGYEPVEKDVFEDPALKYMVTEKDGSFYSEVAITWNFNLPYEEYVNEDGSPKLDKIDERLLYLIGYRIPNQGHNSMLRLKIKRFLPPACADLMLVPSEVTLQMGSDFDVDKMNTYMYNNEVKEGKLVKYESEKGDTKKDIENQIIDINHDVLGDGQVIEAIMQPLGFENLKETADKVDNILSKGKKSYSILHDKTSEDAYVSNKAGKLLTALTSLSATNHALAQEAGLYIKPRMIRRKGELVPAEEIAIKFSNEDRSVYKDASEGNSIKEHVYSYSPTEGAWRLDKVTGFTGRLISEVISELQSASVDNAKEQVLGKANLNKYTYGVAAIIARAGFDERFIINFLTQESIRDLVKVMESLNDPTVPFANRVKKEEAINNLLRDYEKKASINVEGISSFGLSEMFSMIGQESKDEAYYTNQAKILYNFIQYNKIADEITSLQSALSPEASGIGKSLSDTKYKQEQIDDFRKRSKFLGNMEGFFTNTFIGDVLDKSIYQANEIFRKLYPYFEESYRYVERRIAEEMGGEKILNTDTYDFMHREIKAALFSADNFIVSKELLKSERESLLIDRFVVAKDGTKTFAQKSLAQRLIEYSGSNRFFKKLRVELAVQSGEPSYIAYEAAKVEEVGEGLSNSIAWQEALESSSALDKEIAEDLVKYSYLTGGVQSKSSFTKYVPISYVLDSLKLGDKKLVDFEDPSTFQYIVKQIFQHSSNRAKQMNPDFSEMVLKSLPTNAFKSEGKKVIPTPNFIPESFRLPNSNSTKVINLLTNIDGEDKLPTFLSLRESTRGRIALYEKIGMNEQGESEYVRINLLGSPVIREYDINSDVNESVIPSNNVVAPSVKKNTTGINYGFTDKTKEPSAVDSSSDLMNALKQEDIQNSIESIARKEGRFSTLASVLSDKLGGTSIRLDYNLLAKGSENGGLVTINPNNIESQLDLESTLLHEVLHSLTAYKIDKYTKGELQDLTDEEMRSIKSLETLMVLTRSKTSNFEEKSDRLKQLKARHSKLNLMPSEEAEARKLLDEIYGLTSVKEFVAMALTNDTFQKILNGIEFTKSRTLLQRLFDLIQSIVGISVNRGSILEQSVVEALNLIENANYNLESSDTNYLYGFNERNGLRVAKRNRHPEGREVEKLEEEAGLARWIVSNGVNIREYNTTTSDKSINELESKAAKFLKDKAMADRYYVSKFSADGKVNIRFRSKSEPETNFSPSFDSSNDRKTGDKNLDKIINRWTNQIRSIKTQYVSDIDQRSAKQREIEDLESAIDNLVSNKELDTVFDRANLQLKQVEDLLEESPSLSSIKRASTYLQSWNDIGEIFDFEKGTIEQEKIARIISNATILNKKLIERSRELFLNLTNTERPEDRKITQKDFEAQIDTSLFSSYLLDSSASSVAIEQELDRIVKDTAFTINETVKKKHEEIHELAKKADLKKNLDIILQKHSNGSRTGNLVSPYKQEFYSTMKELSQKAKEDPKQGWKKFWKFVSENSHKLSIEEIKKGTSDNFSKEEIEEGKKLLSQYEKDLKSFKDELEERSSYKYEDDEGNLIDEATRMTEYQEELTKWERRNSPYLREEFEKDVQAGRRKGADNSKYKGYKYLLYPKPKKSWEDPNYNKLMSNPSLKDLKEFYEYFKNTVRESKEYLPKGDNIQSNIIPEVAKGFLQEMIDTKGTRVFKALGTAAINSISLESISDREYGIRDEKTGAPIRQLRTRMLNEELSSTEKSYDLENVLKQFVDMSLTFKYKSQVQDKILLGESILLDLQERVVTPEGVNKLDWTNNPIKISNGLNNTKERVKYLVDTFFGKRKELEAVYSEMKSGPLKGRHIVGSKVVDNIIQYTQAKGLGLNPFSGVTNLFFGVVANVLHASSGTEFSDSQMLKAMGIMMSAISPFKGVTKNKVKIAALMEKFQVLGEMNQANYGSRSVFDKLYLLQKMGEYAVQGQVMIAMLMNTSVTDVNGKNRSTWDAYKIDEKGNLVWNEEQFGKSDYQDLEGTSSKNFRALSSKIQQTVKYIHGNYDINSPIRMKKSMWGRVLMVFRNWIPYSAMARLGNERYDYRLNRTFKGRWRSYGAVYRESGLFGIAKTLFQLSLLGKLAGQKANIVNETDLANMKQNLREISLAASLYLMTMLLKGMLMDDDDKESKSVYTYFLNAAKRVDSDMWFFISPKAFSQIVSDPLPPMKTANDFIKLIEKTGGWVIGDDKIKSGRHKGDSAILRAFTKAFPVANQATKTIDTATQVFQ